MSADLHRIQMSLGCCWKIKLSFEVVENNLWTLDVIIIRALEFQSNKPYRPHGGGPMAI